MKKFGIFVLLGGIGTIVMGAQAVYTVVTNWAPTTMECADYLRERPEAKWLRLQNCELDVENAYSFSYLGLYVSEVLIPVRPSGSQNPMIRVLLSTDGDRLEEFVERMDAVKEGGEPAPFTLAKRPELLTQSSVEGLVRYGLELDDEDEEKIFTTVPGLTKDWVLLDEGKSPDRILAFSTFLGGFALLPVGWIILRDSDPKPRPPVRGTAIR